MKRSAPPTARIQPAGILPRRISKNKKHKRGKCCAADEHGARTATFKTASV